MSAQFTANVGAGLAPTRLVARLIAFFHAIWVILRKDIRVLLRQPVNIAATLVPPIAFLLVNALGAAAVGRNPVTLVTLDQGVKGQQKELLLSPASRSAIIAGKVFAGFAITFILGMLVLLLGYVLGWTQPEGVYWLSTLLTIALVSLLSAGLGVAIGAALRRVQVVIAVAINVAIYLFFLSGGIGVLAFEPTWLQNIAAFVALTYGRHALEQAVFYSASDQFGRDMAVLALSALAAIGLGIFSMRRGIAS